MGRPRLSGCWDGKQGFMRPELAPEVGVGVGRVLAHWPAPDAANSKSGWRFLKPQAGRRGWHAAGTPASPRGSGDSGGCRKGRHRSFPEPQVAQVLPPPAGRQPDTQPQRAWEATEVSPTWGSRAREPQCPQSREDLKSKTGGKICIRPGIPFWRLRRKQRGVAPGRGHFLNEGP